jgi:hypothetical protein
MKQSDDWLKELELLAWRFSGLGFGPDLTGMTTSELTALYARLKRLAAGAA